MRAGPVGAGIGPGAWHGMRAFGAGYRTVHLHKSSEVTAVGDMAERGAQPAAISLLFAPGQRPTVAQVRAGATADALLPLGFGHVDAAAGRCEQIVAGLSFDLAGLAPAQPAPMPAVRHWHGVALAGEVQAVSLTCGPHVAGGGRLLPVVRALCAAAVALAELPGCAAVVWNPAGTATAAAMFARLVRGWIEGGAFPVFAFTGLATSADGIASEGLAFFTGQEIRLDPSLGSDKNRVGKLSARVIHSLIGAEPLTTAQSFSGPDGERLVAEPIERGRIVRIWGGPAD